MVILYSGTFPDTSLTVTIFMIENDRKIELGVQFLHDDKSKCKGWYAESQKPGREGESKQPSMV